LHAVGTAPLSTSTMPMLLSRPDGPDGVHVGAIGHLKRRILAAVLRRTMPRVLEASLIPNLLFIVVLSAVNAAAAMISVLIWTIGAAVRRRALRQPIPGVLVLALAGLAARTLLALWSGSPALYFVQPICTTVVVAGVFAGSLFVGRPLICRLAGDFCPMGADVTERPAVRRLFRQLTVLWAVAYLISATVTLTLLLTAPLGVFVAAKTLGSLGLTLAAVALTVWMSWRTAQRERLVFASVPI
jgi:intracellular septation protein A